MARSTDTFSKKVRDNYNQNVMGKGIKIPSGIYRGIVVNNADPALTGRIKVQIMKFYGSAPADLDTGTSSDGSEFTGAMWCRQVLSSGGTTAPAAGPNGGAASTTYGAFGSPPDNGNEVIVAFGGDTHSGIILGVLPDLSRQNGIAGAGVTRTTNTGKETISLETPKTAASEDELPEEHPLAEVLRNAGLGEDMIRGMNYSSPGRDPSSKVSGMSTPAGHSMVMDDGRGEDGTNLSMRMRTAGGAQILMDDTHGLIYINNAEGNAWIEINRQGDIDIYAGRSINYHTEGDFNVHCGGNFNLQAGRDINMKAQGAQGIKLEASNGSFNMKCAANMNLQADANGNIRVSGNYRETARRIDMNGAPAAAASTPSINQLAGNTNVTESISQRVPEHEPWAGHLDVSSLSSTGVGAGGAGAGSGGIAGADDSGQTGGNSSAKFEVAPIIPGGLLQYKAGIDRRIDPALLVMVEELARQFGTPLIITGGFRPSNSTIGASKSQHKLGHAVDVRGTGFTNNQRKDIVAMASKIGIRGIGVYSSGNLHFDNRAGGRVGWGDSYRAPSTPSYIATIMNKHRAGGYS
jgi:phage gp45-like